MLYFCRCHKDAIHVMHTDTMSWNELQLPISTFGCRAVVFTRIKVNTKWNVSRHMHTTFILRVSWYFSAFSQAAKSSSSLAMLSHRNSSLIELLTEWKSKRNYHTESCSKRIDGPATSFIQFVKFRWQALANNTQYHFVRKTTRFSLSPSTSPYLSLFIFRSLSLIWSLLKLCVNSKQYYNFWMRYLCERFSFYPWHCVSPIVLLVGPLYCFGLHHFHCSPQKCA